MDMAKLDDFMATIQSSSTRKSYKNGIRKSEEFLGKPIETLIGSPDAGKTVEKFFVWLKNKGHTQNTARNLVNGGIQYLKYFDTQVKYRKSLGMYKTEMTTRDHLLTIAEVQEMARVADLKEQVILELLLLGLRVGDVCRLEWKQFDVLDQEAPMPLLIRTMKEGTTAHTFVSEELVELLTKYLPLLDKNNKYLLQSARKEHRSIDLKFFTHKLLILICFQIRVLEAVLNPFERRRRFALQVFSSLNAARASSNVWDRTILHNI